MHLVEAHESNKTTIFERRNYFQANIANRAGEKAELMDTWVWFQVATEILLLYDNLNSPV